MEKRYQIYEMEFDDASISFWMEPPSARGKAYAARREVYGWVLFCPINSRFTMCHGSDIETVLERRRHPSRQSRWNACRGYHPIAFWRVPNVAFDTADQKMYWPCPAAGGIERANYDGTDIETAISGIAMPRKVAIDTVNRKAYWVDYGFPNDIRRSNLDGTDRELLFSTTTLSRTPVSVAVDPLDGYYYWTGLGGDLHRTSLDGSDTSIINLAAPLGELAIDAEHRYLYVSAQDGIIRMRLDLSDPMVWRAQNNFSPAGIAVDSTNGRLMLAGYQFSFYGIDISSITLDGTDEGTAFFARNSASDAASAWSYLAIVDIATPEPNSMTLVWPAGIIFLWRRRRGRLH